MLQAAVASGDNRDAFFQQFEYHFDENPFLTLTWGEALLRKCKDVAPDEYAKLHKGTPFYWLARAAFKVHDYETAAFYIDAAVSDDLRAADDRGDDRFGVSTPAILFFVVDDGNPNQASIALVKDLSATIQNAINEHNVRPEATPLNLNDIQQHFFYPALAKGNEYLRTQVTTFLTFMLEWDHRSRLIQLRTEKGTAEPFFLHLFKGCVLFESLLKSKAPPRAGDTLGPILSALLPSLGLIPILRLSDRRAPTRVARWT
jgi:hypothetical protein